MSVTALELLITARYAGGSAFRQMSNDIDGVVASTSKLEKVGAAFDAIGNIMIGAGIAVALGLGKAVDAAAKYEQSLLRAAAAGNLTVAQQQQLSDSIMNLSDTWGVKSQDMADASYYLLSHIQSLGYTWQDVTKNQILPALAIYSVASGVLGNKPGSVNVQTAAQNIPPMLAGMHVPIQQWTQDLGWMTVFEQRSGLTQAQLLASATRFAPTGGFLGLPAPQMLATMAALATLGVSGQGTGGARVGTELGAALRQLFTNSAGTAELAKAMGMPQTQAGEQAAVNKWFKNGQLTDPQGLYSFLYNYLNAPGMMGNPAQRFTSSHNLFGATGQRALLELMTNNGMSVFGNEMRVDPSNPKSPMMSGAQAYDFMLQVAGKQAAGPQAQWDIMVARFQNLAIVIGNLLIPQLIAFAQWAGGAAHALRMLIEAHPAVAKAVALAAVPALLGGGIGMKGIGGVLSYLGENPKALKAVQGGVGNVFGGLFGFGQKTGAAPFSLLGKVGSWIGSRGAAEAAGGRGLMEAGAEKNVFGLGFAMKHFPGAVAEHVTGGGKGSVLGAAFKDVGGGIGNLASLAKGGIAGTIEKIVGAFKNLGPAIMGAVPAILSFGAGLLPIVAIALVIAGVIAIVVLAFLKFRTQATTAGHAILAGLQPLINFFKGVFLSAVKQVEDAWKKAWPSISTAMNSFFKELPKILPLLKGIGAVLAVVFAVIATVLVGLATGFIRALPYIIGFVSKVISFFGDLSAGVIGIVKLIVDTVKAIFSGNWKAVGQDLQNLKKVFLNIWSDILGIVSNFVGMVVNFIWGFIQNVIKFFQSLWDRLVGHSIIPDMINGIINWFKKLPSEVITWVTQMVTQVTTKITTFATNVISTAAQIGKNIITGIGNGFKSMMGWLGGIFGNVIHGAINSIPGGSAMAHALHIPGFASGTLDAPGGLAWVGERGPELVMLPQHSQVVPNGASAMGAQSQGLSSLEVMQLFMMIRDRRYALGQGVMPITYGSLPSQFDLSYRYAYQKTA